MGLTRIRAQQISDIDYKQAVRVITLTDITLSGGAPVEVDGVTLLAGDRILVNGQSNAAQNGLYVVQTLGTGSNGTWVRTSDANEDGEIQPGMVVMVTQGTVYADTPWKLTTNGVIEIGVTELIFEENYSLAFGNVFANGTAVIANTVSAPLTLAAGDNIAITGNNTSKTVTIAVTGITTSRIANGTSNVDIATADGNVTVGVTGSEVAEFSTVGLDVTGNINTGNILTDGYFYANGAPFEPGGTPGGSNTFIQFNDDDQFGGSANLTWNGSELFVDGQGNVTGNLVVGGTVTGNGIPTTTVSDTPPADPEQGDIWIDSDTAIQYIYFTAGGNSQWAEMEAYQSFSSGSDVDFESISSNVLPSANVTYDLGSSANRWNDLWLANSTIYIGEVSISSQGGNLELPSTVQIGNVTLSESGGNLVLPESTTIGSESVITPRISNVQIATSSWVVKDDTAVELGGGYIIINGTGFVSGATVVIGSAPAASTTVISSSVIRAQVNAASAGTYVVYVSNPDGSVAIIVNGLTYSGTPTWVTGSPLPEQLANTEISIQLTATGANVYQLAAGNSLPSGLTLDSAGLLAGNVSIEEETVYSFTVEAIDTELQESPRTFSLTVTVTFPDPYFQYVTLLLTGDGANGAQNNTFLDSSANDFTITRNGNTTQGTFSPFSKVDGRWGNYFDGSGDWLQTPSNAAFALGTGDYTVECWIYATSTPSDVGIYESRSNGTTTDGFTLTAFSGSVIRVWSGGSLVSSSGTVYVNQWTHVAVTRASGTTTLWINGVSQGTSSTSYNCTNTDAIVGGGRYTANSSVNTYFPGYISNFRIVKGTAVYTTGFTPPTAPLTNITNTSLLTCQSNRFIDNSSNNFTITANGNVAVTPFSPFPTLTAYDAATNGGSGYFDGSGDNLTVPTNSENSVGSGSFYFEAWIYTVDASSFRMIIADPSNTGGLFVGLNIDGANRFAIGRTAVAVDNFVNVTWANGQWYHLAVNRNGTSLQFFVNGTQVGSTATNSVNYPSVGYRVGAEQSAGSSPFHGYISGLRLVKSSVNTTNFTIPTAPPDATGSALCLQFTNAGIIDNSMSNNLETVGNAQIDTGVKKYGTGSMEFDGSGDYLVSASSPTLALGSGDFTIESWVYVTAHTNADGCICLNWTGTWSANNWSLHTDHGSANEKFTFWVNNYNTGSPMLTSTTTVATGTWYHVAVTRSGSSWRLFVNGTQEGSTVTSSVAVDNGISWPIYVSGALAGQALNGFIDDLRITKGVARYTSNFTPPETAFPLYGE